MGWPGPPAPGSARGSAGSSTSPGQHGSALPRRREAFPGQVAGAPQLRPGSAIDRVRLGVERSRSNPHRGWSPGPTDKVHNACVALRASPVAKGYTCLPRPHTLDAPSAQDTAATRARNSPRGPLFVFFRVNSDVECFRKSGSDRGARCSVLSPTTVADSPPVGRAALPRSVKVRIR